MATSHHLIGTHGATFTLDSGKEAGKEARERIKELISGTGTSFITAGMGGDTGYRGQRLSLRKLPVIWAL